MAARASTKLDAHERALRLLSVRSRSRRELQQRLRQAGFEDEEVAGTLARLEAVGLIDDERFARELARHQVTVRRAGRRAVADALFAKGIARPTIEAVVAELGSEHDEERAVELARERARRLRSVGPEAAYRRLCAFLARRGYDGAVAREAARRALAEAGPEALGPNG
jgi:regulatory protein